MIHVRTPSRLHFGLIDPAGVTGRKYGGVGMMIEAPGIELSIEPADRWVVEGPLAERAQKVVDWLLAMEYPRDNPHRIRIHRAAPEHKGLGTGTQLTIGIARAVAEACDWSKQFLASAIGPLLGRGNRSAVGIHGFDFGGFVVDGGKKENSVFAPLVARHPFPAEWRIVLIMPDHSQGLHDEREVDAFKQVSGGARLASLLTQQVFSLLAALCEEDFQEFSEALFQFNSLAGSAFSNVQGGHYASPVIAGLVEWLRERGVRGVGQSSWGPTVFAVVRAEEEATWLVKQMQSHHPVARHEVVVTAASARGADAWRD